MNTQSSEIFPKRNKLLDPAEGISDNFRKVRKGIAFLFGGKLPHEADGILWYCRKASTLDCQWLT